MDASTTEKILEHLCQTIGGDWLLVGGALVQMKLKRGSTIDCQDVRSALKKLPAEELNEEKLKLWSSPEAFRKYLKLKA